PTFIDGFLGGGAASLYAKARGYRVLCNDVALRSYVVGKALIENHQCRLTHDDLVKLSVPTKEAGYAERTLAPEVFPLGHARYLDVLLAHARSLRGNKRWLAQLLVIKHALRLRPMGNFGAKTVMKQAAAGEWEDMNPHYVKDLVNRGLPRHPFRLAENLVPKINAGVFSNGKQNEAHQGDVLEFLGKVEGDICYLDPPYAGTQSYERAMKPLDELLNGGPQPAVSNPYSSEAPEVTLPRLFEAARHVPVLVLSYGNQRIDLAGLMDLMRRHGRDVTGQAISYVHCTGLAGEESRKKNQELLVIGRLK
ncbi:MAG: hypothetical protein GY838_07470, partial [bacterium]|nr:hypothetical protein [bacterium]